MVAECNAKSVTKSATTTTKDDNDDDDDDDKYKTQKLYGGRHAVNCGQSRIYAEWKSLRKMNRSNEQQTGKKKTKKKKKKQNKRKKKIIVPTIGWNQTKDEIRHKILFMKQVPRKTCFVEIARKNDKGRIGRTGKTVGRRDIDVIS